MALGDRWQVLESSETMRPKTSFRLIEAGAIDPPTTTGRGRVAQLFRQLQNTQLRCSASLVAAARLSPLSSLYVAWRKTPSFSCHYGTSRGLRKQFIFAIARCSGWGQPYPRISTVSGRGGNLRFPLILTSFAKAGGLCYGKAQD